MKWYIKLISVILSFIFCGTSVLIQIHVFGGKVLLEGLYWTPVYVVFLVTSVILRSGYLINLTTSKCYSKVLVSLCLVLFFTSLGMIIAGVAGFTDILGFRHKNPAIPVFGAWGASLGSVISIKRFFK